MQGLALTDERLWPEADDIVAEFFRQLCGVFLTLWARGEATGASPCSCMRIELGFDSR